MSKRKSGFFSRHLERLSKSVSGKGTVLALSDTCTYSAFDTACQLFEEEGESVEEVVVCDYDILKFLDDELAIRTSESITIGAMSIIYGEKLIERPKRSFSIYIAPKCPSNEVLLISSKGNAKKIIVKPPKKSKKRTSP